MSFIEFQTLYMVCIAIIVMIEMQTAIKTENNSVCHSNSLIARSCMIIY